MASFDDLKEIPAIAELAGLPQWVLWNVQHRNGKPTKVPFQPNGLKAMADTPRTWSSFDRAAAAATANGAAGLGWVLTRASGIVFVDLDACRDPATGAIQAWALAICRRFGSYTEVSPSGTGLHILCRGDIGTHLNPDRPTGRKTSRPHGIEVYREGRFTTITGDTLAGFPDAIVAAQSALDWLMATYFAAPPCANGHAHAAEPGIDMAPPEGGDGHRPLDHWLRTDTLIEPCAFPWHRMEVAKANDPKLAKTWERKRRDLKDDSLSGYDMALATRCAMLGFDPREIAAVLVAFRQRHAPSDAKALRRDYVSGTVKRALHWARKGGTDADLRAELEEHTRRELAEGGGTPPGGGGEGGEAGPPPPDPRVAKAKAIIKDRLEVDVERVIQTGTDPATFFIVVGAKEVRIGDGEAFMSQRIVRRRLFEEGFGPFPSMKGPLWDTVLRALNVLKEMREDPEQSFGGRIGSMLKSYFDFRPVVNLDAPAQGDEATLSKSSAVIDKLPFLENGLLHVHVQDAVAVLGTMSDFKNPNELRSFLKLHEFHTKTVWAQVEGSAKGTTRYYYVGRPFPWLEP